MGKFFSSFSFICRGDFFFFFHLHERDIFSSFKEGFAFVVCFNSHPPR